MLAHRKLSTHLNHLRFPTSVIFFMAALGSMRLENQTASKTESNWGANTYSQLVVNHLRLHPRTSESSDHWCPSLFYEADFHEFSCAVIEIYIPYCTCTFNLDAQAENKADHHAIGRFESSLSLRFSLSHELNWPSGFAGFAIRVLQNGRWLADCANPMTSQSQHLSWSTTCVSHKRFDRSSEAKSEPLAPSNHWSNKMQTALTVLLYTSVRIPTV